MKMPSVTFPRGDVLIHDFVCMMKTKNKKGENQKYTGHYRKKQKAFDES